VALTRIGDFEAPVYVTQAPGGADLYVVEQGGRIRTVSPQGRVRPDPFLDISDKVTDSGEEGLLSVAFPPDYASSGRFYVYYSDRSADERLVEYRRSAQDPLRADPASARLLLHLDDPFPNHNGGLLLFGPDGDLYLGNGDGGSEGDPRRNGQGHLEPLRQAPAHRPAAIGRAPYSIPAGNRFAPGAAPEVYAYGLRNPWRYSFDRATGELWIGDVGQDRFEEIDRAPGPASGANYGWSAFEGRARYNRDQRAPGAVPPFLAYGRDRGCSVTGGYVVRDPALRTLYGRYLYADFCAGQLRSFAPAASGPQEIGRSASKSRPSPRLARTALSASTSCPWTALSTGWTRNEQERGDPRRGFDRPARGGGAGARPATRRRQRGRRPAPDRRLRPSGLRRRRSRLPAAPLRRRAAGPRQGHPQRPQAAPLLPQHQRPRQLRRLGARAALDRLPPDYRRTKRFYVYYNDAQGDIRVDEFRRSTATRAAPGSRRSVLQIPHHANSNHNGGQLQFLGHLL
jgi:glucose/arabinose dehydrogenase